MTVEKAIEILSDVGDINRCCAEDAEALDMAIKALEQQSCEDCISREATIEAIYKKYIGGKDAIKNAPINDLYAEGLAEAVDAVWDMPSVTPKAEQKAVLDKIRAEILDEAEYAYADFDRYKEDILHAEPDELPDDDFRYGLERAVEIINKYKAESEGNA